MKLWILLLMLFAYLNQPISYAEDPTTEKRSDIKKLIKITGTDRLAIQNAQQVSDIIWENFRKSNQDVPDKLILIVQNEMMSVVKENTEGLMDRMVPLFDKYLTHDEIKGLIKYHQSDLGQKMIKIQPLLLSESVAISREWGQSLNPEIDRRIKAAFEEEGIEIPENFSFF